MSEGLPDKDTVASFYFFINKVAHPSQIKPRGAYLPSGQSVALGTPGCENLFLIGDAAGLIDPFTGEGIYYALLSAQIAADTILSDVPTCSDYRRRMERVIATITENCQVRDELYTPSILNSAIVSLGGVPKYGEVLIDQAIIRYSKSYKDAYEEFKSYAR